MNVSVRTTARVVPHLLAYIPPPIGWWGGKIRDGEYRRVILIDDVPRYVISCFYCAPGAPRGCDTLRVDQLDLPPAERGEAIELIDGRDPATVEAALRRDGVRKVGVSWLIQHGIAVLESEEKFNKLRGYGDLMNCIDYQFDSGGIAAGVGRTYRIAVGDYVAEYRQESSH